jgi:hypothetical protein
MPQVLLVNPSPRKGIKRKSASKGKAAMATRKKPRTAAQKRATAKMIAANRSRKRASPAQKAMVKRSVKRRAAYAASTPKRRKYKRSSVAAASSAGRTLRYRRPNPIGNFFKDTLIPSAVGGAGALALDVAVAALPLPPAMKTGPMAPIVKVAGAVGLGMLAGQFLGRKTGEQVAAGALTVTIYNFARVTLNRLSGGKIPGLAMYPDGYLNAYVSDAEVPELGYEGSGMQVGEYVSPDGVEGYETGVYR